MKELAWVALIALSFGVGYAKSPQQSPTPEVSSPMEIFKAKEECARVSKGYIKEHKVAYSGKPAKWDSYKWNYDPSDHICYIGQSITTYDEDGPEGKKSSTYITLFDAQNEDPVAYHDSKDDSGAIFNHIHSDLNPKDFINSKLWTVAK